MDIRPKTTPDYRRKWAILAAVGMGIFLATIDSSIVNVALPTLVEAFDTRFATVQWVVLSYLLTLATLLLSIGRWADIIGKKPIYLLGMLIFSLGSFLCGTSISVYWLIAFRVVQAIGAAMMISLGAGIITEAFPLEERGKALGATGSIVSIGIITAILIIRGSDCSPGDSKRKFVFHKDRRSRLIGFPLKKLLK